MEIKMLIHVPYKAIFLDCEFITSWSVFRKRLLRCPGATLTKPHVLGGLDRRRVSGRSGGWNRSNVPVSLTIPPCSVHSLSGGIRPAPSGFGAGLAAASPHSLLLLSHDLLYVCLCVQICILQDTHHWMRSHPNPVQSHLNS